MPFNWTWLHAPYIANIFILVPVCYQMIWGQGVVTVFEGRVDESEGLRLLVASLWSGILFASCAGLFFPQFFMPVIGIQIFYKAMWLLTFSLPAFAGAGIAAVPIGISGVFAAICLSYPVFLFLHTSSQAVQP